MLGSRVDASRAGTMPRTWPLKALCRSRGGGAGMQDSRGESYRKRTVRVNSAPRPAAGSLYALRKFSRSRVPCSLNIDSGWN